MRRKTVYLGLGSNVGDRIGNLKTALTRLADSDGIALTGLSPIYQTEPIGYEAQEDFFNMVARAETTLSPADLLSAVKAVEKDMGRIETVHKGPRTIDIDILLLGDEVVNEYKLSIPHARMLEREFVLRPLYDLDPGLRIPPLRIAVGDALLGVEGAKRVMKVQEGIELSEVTGG